MGINKVNKAVFLDRDGVINKAIIKDGKAYSPRCFDEFRFIDNIAEHILELKKAGLLLIVATNQPDIARGKLKIAELEKMNEYIYNNLDVDHIFVCIHDDLDNCSCRKPKPGMLLDASDKYGIDIKNSYFIGDGWKDMSAAKSAGCKGLLIDKSYNSNAECFKRVKDLGKAVKVILNIERRYSNGNIFR